MRELKHDGLAVPGRVELAQEPGFTLGVLRIYPATREVACGEVRETLEPRVMQVLVALARADEHIITRDELTEWCWAGRIVGDDALNRTISRVRHVASGIGRRSFSIETVTKVGYRLLAEKIPEQVGASEPPAAVNMSPMSRRMALSSACALAIGGVGLGVVSTKPWRHRPSADALELVRRGDLAQRASRPDQTRQAVSYFEQAVRLDPLYGVAWGALALSYTHSLDGFSEAQLASLPIRIRSAAKRALELEPDNVDAQLALACIAPNFRNWSGMERELRRIQERFPEHWLANGRLAILYYQVGRMSEGARLHQRVIARDPMIPGPYAFAATALSSLGRVQEADALLKNAADRWPANPLIWEARYKHLLFSGRAGSAAALILDPEARPSGLTDIDVRPYHTLARAVDSGQPEDVDAAFRYALETTRRDARAVPGAAPIFALLGRLDLTFASLERYLLNRGSFGAPAQIASYTRRYTDFLFSPPLASARKDSRFDVLCRSIGLDDYWRDAGMARRAFPL